MLVVPPTSMFITRKATPDDADELARFVNVVFQFAEDHQFMDGIRTNAGEIKKALDNGTTILVIEDTTKDTEYAFLGSVALKSTKDKKIAEIGMLSVSREKQSLGIGRFLMNTAMEYAKREMGAEEIIVGIINIRERMITWYEKLGFKNTGETEEFHSDTEKAMVPLHLCIYKRTA